MSEGESGEALLDFYEDFPSLSSLSLFKSKRGW